MFVPFKTAINQNQITWPLKDFLIDSEGGSIANPNQLWQSLKDSLMDLEERSSADSSYPEITIEMDTAQLINQLLI